MIWFPKIFPGRYLKLSSSSKGCCFNSYILEVQLILSNSSSGGDDDDIINVVVIVLLLLSSLLILILLLLLLLFFTPDKLNLDWTFNWSLCSAGLDQMSIVEK